MIERMPRLGMGTWHMGERESRRAAEVAALRLGLDLGITLIDTAEMYGAGGAEEVVREAIRGRRDGVYVVTKFYPHHAGARQLLTACEGSLGRLGIDALGIIIKRGVAAHQHDVFVAFDEQGDLIERFGRFGLEGGAADVEENAAADDGLVAAADADDLGLIAFRALALDAGLSAVAGAFEGF